MEKLTEDHTWNDKLKKLHKKKYTDGIMQKIFQRENYTD